MLSKDSKNMEFTNMVAPPDSIKNLKVEVDKNKDLCLLKKCMRFGSFDNGLGSFNCLKEVGSSMKANANPVTSPTMWIEWAKIGTQSKIIHKMDNTKKINKQESTLTGMKKKSIFLS